MNDRIVPEIPPLNHCINILIDSDVANEIDDVYAIAFVLSYPERFKVEGIIATHFAQSGDVNSKEKSYEILQQLLQQARKVNCFPTKIGSHPMQYSNLVNESEGVDFIIETANKYTKDSPLWILSLGAATNIACALIKAPEIKDKIRCVFHARSEHTWPKRTEQFNIYGDIIAAQNLLQSGVPLVWFDTGTYICASYEKTQEKLAPLNSLGSWLHHYRDRCDYYRQEGKGFFDMGDILFLLDPRWAKTEIVDVPNMTRFMFFNHTEDYGKMLRVYDIDVEKTWDLFYEGISRFSLK